MKHIPKPSDGKSANRMTETQSHLNKFPNRKNDKFNLCERATEAPARACRSMRVKNGKHYERKPEPSARSPKPYKRERKHLPGVLTLLDEIRGTCQESQTL